MDDKDEDAEVFQNLWESLADDEEDEDEDEDWQSANAPLTDDLPGLLEIINTPSMSKPERAKAALRAGEILVDTGRPSDALVQLDTAANLVAETTDKLSLYLNRASCFSALGQATQEVSELTRYIDLWQETRDPNHSETIRMVLFQRGRSFMNLRRLEDALADFENLKALEPNDARGWLGFGTVRHLMGDGDVVPILEHARKLFVAKRWAGTIHGPTFDTDPVIFQILADLYTQVGNTDGAFENFDYIVQGFPTLDQGAWDAYCAKALECLDAKEAETYTQKLRDEYPERFGA